MRKFVTPVFDSKTNMRMIYSECSYNMACMELEKEMDTQGILLVSATMDGDLHRLEWSDGSVYYYDEERGYLLRKEVVPQVHGWWE